MEKMDVAIALAGAVVLVVAITGSAVYGGAGVAGASAFSVTFPTMEMELEQQGFTTNGAGQQLLTFNVSAENVTKVTFSATARDPSGQAPGSVEITVTTPDGDQFSGTGSVEAPVAPAPEATTAQAASADAVPLPPPRTNGTGDWEVLVVVSSQAPLPVPYTVTVSAVVTHYEADVTPVVPDATR